MKRLLYAYFICSATLLYPTEHHRALSQDSVFRVILIVADIAFSYPRLIDKHPIILKDIFGTQRVRGISIIKSLTTYKKSLKPGATMYRTLNSRYKKSHR